MIKTKTHLLIFILILFYTICSAQPVQIQDYSINNLGQVELEIEGQSDKYYTLQVLHEPSLTYETITSMTMGVDGPMIISEPLAAYSIQNYQVVAHSIASPDDTDGDGIDDLTEFNDMPTLAPLNFANEVPFNDGATSINSPEFYSALAVVNDNIPWAPFLNNQEFAKFAILNQDSDEAEVYFINSNTHYIHADFLGTINTAGADIVTGEVVYNPNSITPNGVIGTYSFNYSFGSAYTFEHSQRTFELLARNMPFLQNNLNHFIGNGGEGSHVNNFAPDFVGSRLNVVLESELVADVDFLPFHQAEGYGYFRHMDLSETPNSRDIVLYDALPNSLPRVGGIITSVLQTPLSHVNLRAIQDNVPNAYIKNPLAIDSIANLLENYIYYKVEQDKYTIREATLEEVNAWYEDLRPTDAQIPIRDLSQTSILPLDDIEFEMATAFGAKCSNVATMRNFGFPEGTIPDGFGIPFYFYDEFMKYNGFYDDVEAMLANPNFIGDLQTRVDMLDVFRDEIKDGDMPQWMLDELQAMHDGFPDGQPVRCRSSTNNEDLPGFSGAGLYTSKTQHPSEGHISKSVKQVYASMWNFRAYEERDFYRVDHFIAAMGILCHPNFEDEKSNGVGISIDPVFNTQNTFYLNTQLGESLITNPDPNDIPEEILLYEDPNEGYLVLRYSNLVGLNQLIMDDNYLNQMRDYLTVIHNEFEILYDVVGAEGFGMDIEYKVTVDDQLIIKQARPWVSFWSEINSNYDLGVIKIVEPQSSSSLGNAELITAEIANQGLEEMNDYEVLLLIDGQLVETMTITEPLDPFNEVEYQFTIPQDFSAIGDYDVMVIVADELDGFSRNDTLLNVISNLHLLEGGLNTELNAVKCGGVVDVFANVTNYGENTWFNTEIEVIVNGMAVDTVTYGFSIPYLVNVNIPISVSENLNPTNNIITLNLLRVNGSSDAVDGNNSSSIVTDLETEYDNITFILNADNFPEETSWNIFDLTNTEVVASGSMTSNDEGINEDVCVNYNSCLVLTVNDSFGDGICCGYGQGDFSVVNTAGEVLVYNNGNFGVMAEEVFCLGNGCLITADVTTTNATEATAADGGISINIGGGTSPFQISIDGGLTFSSNVVFSDLAPGDYDVVIGDALGECVYEETVEVEFDIMSNINNLSKNSIKLYPNPTQEDFILDFSEASFVSNNVSMEIYNNLGQLIERQTNLSVDNNSRLEVTLSAFTAGTFMVRVFDEGLEEYFVVLKI